MPDLPQSVVLHIGAHKTASSHLQKTLYLNRTMLKENGTRVLGPRTLRDADKSIASMFGLSWSESGPPRRKRHKQLKFLAQGAGRVVFSEENFVGMLKKANGCVRMPLYPEAGDKIAEFAAAVAPIRPKVFLAVRDPAAFITSAYSQALFGGTYISPRRYRMRNDWRRIDWAEYIARLRAAPGIGRLIVWRLEDYTALQPVILRKMLRWKAGRKTIPLAERVHQGLSVAAVRHTLDLAALDDTDPRHATRARKRFPVDDKNRKFQLYSPATLTEARAVYDAQMARIAAMDGVRVLSPPVNGPDISPTLSDEG